VQRNNGQNQWAGEQGVLMGSATRDEYLSGHGVCVGITDSKSSLWLATELINISCTIPSSPAARERLCTLRTLRKEYGKSGNVTWQQL
jgi:hypothetical protein